MTRYQKLWHKNLHNDNRRAADHKNKLRTYRKFKSQFGREDYLSSIPQPEMRVELLKFRVSCHKLHIETGRHPYIPIEMRLCQLCDKNKIEDEEHFLMECEVYSEERTVAFDNISKISENFYNLDEYEKFIWLMSSRHKGVLHTLAKLLVECRIKRNNIMTEVSS